MLDEGKTNAEITMELETVRQPAQVVRRARGIAEAIKAVAKP